MTNAQCACGALRLMLNEPPQLTALCHCLACQRRTGAPFSANAFYSIDCVEISGVSTEYIRTAESGRKVRMHFCPTCGSTLFWKADASPSWIGVAVVHLPIRPSRHLPCQYSNGRNISGCSLRER